MAVTLVQSTSSNTTSLTFGSPTTAGNLIAVCIASFNGASAVSGITLGGSADHFMSAVTTAGASTWGFIWVDYNCAGGQTAIAVSGTLTVDASNGIIVAYEFSGLDTTSSVVDQTSTLWQNGVTSWDSGTTLTTTVPAEAWVGCCDTGQVITAPASPWTNIAGGFGCAGYQIVSSTGTADYAGTQSSGSQASASVVTLKGVTGASANAGLAAASSAAGAGEGTVRLGMTIRGS